MYVITHPFDGMWDLTHEKRGSIAAGNTILLLFFLTNLWNMRFEKFLFNRVRWERVNIWQQILGTLFPLLIYCVANWCLTTLFDGKGRLGQVYMATCYSLLPYPLIQFPLIIMSNVVTTEERGFYDVLGWVSVVWMLGLIVLAMGQIHEYSVAKNILFSAASVFAMLVIVFILLLFFSMISQGLAYFVSIGKEIMFQVQVKEIFITYFIVDSYESLK